MVRRNSNSIILTFSSGRVIRLRQYEGFDDTKIDQWRFLKNDGQSESAVDTFLRLAILDLIFDR